MQRKIESWEGILYVCIVGILLTIINIPIARNIEATTVNPTLGDDTYFNATVEIISCLYKVSSVTDDEMILEDCRLPVLPGVFRISDANGVQELNRGGWMNSKVTITGFDVFFKDWLFSDWGLYVIIWGECDKVRVQTFR